VYLGMILGRLPGFALDRTGVALLGALVLIATKDVRTNQLATAIDIPTLALLFGLMIVSAQFRLSGFYSYLVRRIGVREISPPALLAVIIGLTGLLSAVLANDIVCLAMTPVLIEGCARRSLDPKPYLLALACAANIGSAATLIGNPQNILIGQVLRLSFSGYLLDGLVPSVLGLLVVWLFINWQAKGQWKRETSVPELVSPAFNAWQTGKGILILVLMVAFFLAGRWPRELVALGAASILLASRKIKSRDVLGLVDWQLLALFISLFIVNFAVQKTGFLAVLQSSIASAGITSSQPAWLFGLSVVLSNLVSNVPAVMLLLPSATHPTAGAVLALSSTLAGNFLIVGSIANIIVVDQAGRLGVPISWREHARTGVPVSIVTLGLAALWLWIRSM
jgi:Na+/H+ antiporter NhaD/arsenite permease-like protein